MLSSPRVEYLLLFGLGVLVVFASVAPMGYAMAVAVPASYFDFFRNLGSLELGLFVLSIASAFVAAGLSSLVAQLAAYHAGVQPSWRTAMLFVAGALFPAYVLMPLTEGMPMFWLVFARSWFDFGMEWVLVATAWLSLILARRLWPPGEANASDMDSTNQTQWETAR